ncbi:MAG: glycosyltransferase, partial [Sphingobacteriales bacterium]
HAGYTVSTGLAEVFLQRYGRPFDVIRNMPVARTTQPVQREERLLLYQGAVNEARGFEYIIPALRGLPFRLLVCGDGNFMEQLRALISEHGVSQQVELLGMVAPDELPAITARAWLGLNFLEPEGTSQYLSLTNKFFDYVQEGLPQLASDYPEYRRYNAEYEVALLIPLTTEAIAGALQRLEADSDLYRRLQANTLVARPNWTWEGEAVRLLEIIQTTLAQHGR